ncbi:MAG: hypothetical protein JWP01_1249 [Myxococcales bacterium]|nr:hypothetical protein [Myxococcales bacterium]
MMRFALLAIGLAIGCTRHGGATSPAVDAPPQILAALDVQHTPGEQMAWDVFWQGMAVGHAELIAGIDDARITFRTGTLASALASVSYQLATAIEQGRARTVTEVLTRDGETRRVEAALGATSFTLRGVTPRRTPDGQPLHTLASALGVVRTWSQGTPTQGYLWLIHGGELYRLDVFPPVRDEALGHHALRIDAVVRASDHSVTIDLSVWLAANRDRTPLRFVVEEGSDRVSAELVETTGQLD